MPMISNIFCFKLEVCADYIVTLNSHWAFAHTYKATPIFAHGNLGVNVKD